MKDKSTKKAGGKDTRLKISAPDEKGQDPLERIQRDYRAVFAGDAGKRVLADLETICFMKTPPFRGRGSDDCLVNVGSQRVFMHINTMLTMNIERLREIRDLIKTGRLSSR